MNGLALWLFSNTSFTDMSLSANTSSSIANATSVSAPCTTATARIGRTDVDFAPQRQQHQHELISGEPGRQPQRRKAGFGDHFASVFPALCSAERLPSSGGM